MAELSACLRMLWCRAPYRLLADALAGCCRKGTHSPISPFKKDSALDTCRRAVFTRMTSEPSHQVWCCQKLCQAGRQRSCSKNKRGATRFGQGQYAPSAPRCRTPRLQKGLAVVGTNFTLPLSNSEDPLADDLEGLLAGWAEDRAHGASNRAPGPASAPHPPCTLAVHASGQQSAR